MLVIDLARFNASLGRNTGDELLGLVAERFRSVVGRSNIVARLEADKFACPAFSSSIRWV
jgi:GGDEF domain-containing protein